MQHIEVMNAEEFAALLSKMKTDDVVEFGLYDGGIYPDENPECDDVSEWYFAKKLYIEGYNSSFIILDYAWRGGRAYCIPLDYDTSKTQMEMFTRTYFHHLEYVTGETTKVFFVEIND